MSNPHLGKEDETVEDLQLRGLRLIQKKNGFRFGMDSVLLADFARIRSDDIVADFGTGTGILPLLLIGREKGRLFHALEIQESLAETAVRTMKMNHLEDRVHVIHGNACMASSCIPPCSIDAVVCNPPYGLPGASLKNENCETSIARHQTENTVAGFCKSAFWILKGKGRIFMIYPASQMLNLMQTLQNNHLEPKRFRLVYPFADKPANLVLIEAVKDAKPLLQPMPPLIIYQADGSLTNELKSVYHIS